MYVVYIKLPLSIHQSLSNNIVNSCSESTVIKHISNFVQSYGKEELCNVWLKKDCSTPIECSLMYYAADKYYESVLIQLIDYGLNVDVGTKSHEKQFSNDSPLMLACEKNHLKVINLLLGHNANVLHTNDYNCNILMMVKSIEACRAVLQAAIVKGDVLTLLLARDLSGNGVFNYPSIKEKSEIYNTLTGTAFAYLCLGGFDDYLKEFSKSILDACTIENKLAYPRYAYFLFPEKSQFFDKLCDLVRQENTSKETTTQFHSILFHHAAFDLYGLSGLINPFIEEYLPNTKPNKEHAQQFAITKTLTLLASPQSCFKYLMFLNQEFKRYFQEKHHYSFPQLDPDTYEYKSLADLVYPIPKANYTGIKQFHALPEFLIALFRKHGLANNAYKWIGFIPHQQANNAIEQGDFVMEDRLGMGLFHNKLSHMLQIAILLYAMNDKYIDVNYVEKDTQNIKAITIQDILNGLVKSRTPTNTLLWTIVMDTRSPGVISFYDPHRLGTFIMQNGPANHMSELATSLISTFCNGLLKLLHAYRQVRAFEGLTLDLLLEKLNDFNLAEFFNPPYLIEQSLLKSKQKGSEEIIEAENNHHGIAKKHYQINEGFIPRDFSFFSNPSSLSTEPERESVKHGKFELSN